MRVNAVRGELFWYATLAVGLFCVCSRDVSAGAYRVLNVVRGDRIVVDFQGAPEEVKLLRIEIPSLDRPNSPQGSPLGVAAAEFIRQQLAGKAVDLEFEGPLRGPSCRLRAYVMVDGANLNLELVRQGFSPYITRFGTSVKHDEAFSAAETSAGKTDCVFGPIPNWPSAT